LAKCNLKTISARNGSRAAEKGGTKAGDKFSLPSLGGKNPRQKSGRFGKANFPKTVEGKKRLPAGKSPPKPKGRFLRGRGSGERSLKTFFAVDPRRRSIQLNAAEVKGEDRNIDRARSLRKRFQKKGATLSPLEEKEKGRTTKKRHSSRFT